MNRSEVISDQPLRRMADLFDWPTPGDTVPTGWHWLYFLPEAAQAQLGPDGHMARGKFMPDLPGRRMFAGASISVRRPLRVGDSATLTETVSDVVTKQGRTGPLSFVTVNRVITVADEIAVVEDQTIVYAQSAPPRPELRVGGDPVAGVVLRPDAVMLFRFSALTYNGHRIHYDRDYVREVEGYPDLVVHGPLITLALLDLRPSPSSFSFRATSPFFVDDEIHLVDNGSSLDAFHADGRIGLSVRI